MEDLVIRDLFQGVYLGKRVFITGDTGFKGSWLALWLQSLGAEVSGYSLYDLPSPSHFELLKLSHPTSYEDIRDKEKLMSCLEEFKPDIVFHLAAQPLVIDSFKDPYLTFQTNTVGTLNLMEVVRDVRSVKAVLVVTTDKVYQNRGDGTRFTEQDPLGGSDPYSASKSAAEIIVNAYRDSFAEEHGILIATARAGNVIGGGDWGANRLVPDIVRATVGNKPTLIRNPEATRPWQHVLEPLSGYLLLGMHLLKGSEPFAEAWNFGPFQESCYTVTELVDLFSGQWPQVQISFEDSMPKNKESQYLMLDNSKSKELLSWQPLFDMEETVNITANWYRDYYEKGIINTRDNLNQYINSAKKKHFSWTE